jgi:hypothetical protein
MTAFFEILSKLKLTSKFGFKRLKSVWKVNVVLLHFKRTNVTRRSQHITPFVDFRDAGGFAEAGNISVLRSLWFSTPFPAPAGEAANAISANNNISTYLAKYPIRRVPFLNAQSPPDFHQRKRPGTVANQPYTQGSHATCACERDRVILRQNRHDLQPVTIKLYAPRFPPRFWRERHQSVPWRAF